MEALGETTRTAAVEGMLAEGLVARLNAAEFDAALVGRIAGAGPGDFFRRQPGFARPSAKLPVGEVANPTHTDIGPSDKPLADDRAADSHQPKAAIAPPLIDGSVDDISRLDLALRDLSAELIANAAEAQVGAARGGFIGLCRRVRIRYLRQGDAT